MSITAETDYRVDRLALAMRRAMTIIRHLEVEDNLGLSAATAHMVLYTALDELGLPVNEEEAP